jgi:hypothetical protein
MRRRPLGLVGAGTTGTGGRVFVGDGVGVLVGVFVGVLVGVFVGVSVGVDVGVLVGVGVLHATTTWPVAEPLASSPSTPASSPVTSTRSLMIWLVPLHGWLNVS